VLVVGAAACTTYGINLSLPGPGRGRDLGEFIANARGASAGLSPYGTYLNALERLPDGTPAVAPPLLSPPISIVIYYPLAWIEPHAASWAVFALSVAAGALAIGLLARAYPERVWLAVPATVTLTGMWQTLSLGNTYTFLGLDATIAWLALRAQRWYLGGILLGPVCALKPPFGLWPLLLLLSGRWQAAAAATATTAALSLVPALLFGPHLYLEWLHATAAFRIEPQDDASSLVGVSLRLGAPWLGPIAAMVLVAGLAAISFRCRPRPELAGGLGLAGAFLSSPLSWATYIPLLLPALFGAPRGAAACAAWVLLSIPATLLVLALGPAIGMTYGMLHLAAVAAMCLAYLGVRRRTRDDEPDVMPPDFRTDRLAAVAEGSREQHVQAWRSNSSRRSPSSG
jgi:hypothetical protein